MCFRPNRERATRLPIEREWRRTVVGEPSMGTVSAVRNAQYTAC